jgi:hypothetical protein
MQTGIMAPMKKSSHKEGEGGLCPQNQLAPLLFIEVHVLTQVERKSNIKSENIKIE